MLHLEKCNYSMNPKVDFFFNKTSPWQSEILHLRHILLQTGLQEELKWGCPCYTHNNNNIVLIHHFKEYCALLFFKGVLLADPYQLLIQQTKNVQVPRQMRFTSADDVNGHINAIKEYVAEAVQIENSGLKAALKAPDEFEMAVEFKQKLESIAELKQAFEALTPGRQRAYLLYFSQPKQSKTRESRVEKCLPLIMNGRGLND